MVQAGGEAPCAGYQAAHPPAFSPVLPRRRNAATSTPSSFPVAGKDGPVLLRDDSLV